ncbi:alpha-(1,3)-fucosyltransferase 10 [Calliopsis andreniformis]|uniref:alpha-(1,3)-fucosyltransferase 10 n=1 Tax=Calliopsis andreniformis TaxID=337506 RepID=UPI003FCC5E7E
MSRRNIERDTREEYVIEAQNHEQQITFLNLDVHINEVTIHSGSGLITEKTKWDMNAPVATKELMREALYNSKLTSINQNCITAVSSTIPIDTCYKNERRKRDGTREFVDRQREVRSVTVTVAVIVILIATVIVSLIQFNNEEYYSALHLNVPVILWWTPFGNDNKLRKCDNYQCYFTSNRTYQFHQKISSFLFYGSSFQIDDLPKWKSDKVPWGLIHEESPRNNPIFVQQETLNLFTYSSTFSRFSDVPLTLIDLPGIRELLDRKYFIPTNEKTKLMYTKNLAPLLYIQSDCDTASNRDIYVAELMKYIKVDSYGTCLNNAQLDERLKENYLEVLNSEDFLSFTANYKFTIAFENAVCQDYITEKLWRPLIVGSVPIYYGSPSFKDWLPNNMSAISILDFKNPRALANFLLDLIKNETEYNKYLSHKLIDNYEIANQRLKKALEYKHKWFRSEFGNYVEEFECFVCENIQKIEEQKLKIVDKKHYDCPLPKNPITNTIDHQDWWTKQWILEKCGAKVLVNFLKTNVTITKEKFESDKMKLYSQNKC